MILRYAHKALIKPPGPSASNAKFPEPTGGFATSIKTSHNLKNALDLKYFSHCIHLTFHTDL